MIGSIRSSGLGAGMSYGSSQPGGHGLKTDEHIVRYTANELADMRRRGESRTAHARVDAMTDEELEASIDRAEEGEIDWTTIQFGIPHRKQQVTVRFDVDVIDWFKAQGAGYQTRMNAVLRSFVEAQKNHPATGESRSR